jgi:hypothetical protein
MREREEIQTLLFVQWLKKGNSFPVVIPAGFGGDPSETKLRWIPD